MILTILFLYIKFSTDVDKFVQLHKLIFIDLSDNYSISIIIQIYIHVYIYSDSQTSTLLYFIQSWDLVIIDLCTGMFKISVSMGLYNIMHSRRWFILLTGFKPIESSYSIVYPYKCLVHSITLYFKIVTSMIIVVALIMKLIFKLENFAIAP